MSFNDKVVIITGASSGIGAAIAIKFAEEKAKVVLVARNQQRLKEVADICQKHVPKPLTIIADVAKDEDVKKVIKITIAEYGRIDILINNAGALNSVLIYEEKAMEVFDQIMTTNLRSAVFLTHLASSHLIKTKGNIVNISSIAALDTIGTGHTAYCTSKGGMDHFSRAAALDLGSKGVRVNTVNPGPVQTPIIEAGFGIKKDETDAFWKKWEPNTALGRVSMPDEVADLVLFLASEKAKGITGSSYLIDNGVLLKRNLNNQQYSTST